MEKEEENRVNLAVEAKEVSQGTDDKPARPRNLVFYIDDHECRLIPVGFYKPNEDVREISNTNGDFTLDFTEAEKHGGKLSLSLPG